MTTSQIRKKVISYIVDVDDKKLKAIYSIFQNDIEHHEAFFLNEEHLAILDKEQQDHKSGKTQSYSWKEAKELVRKK